jgi:hypothetical protein
VLTFVAIDKLENVSTTHISIVHLNEKPRQRGHRRKHH